MREFVIILATFALFHCVSDAAHARQSCALQPVSTLAPENVFEPNGEDFGASLSLAPDPNAVGEYTAMIGSPFYVGTSTQTTGRVHFFKNTGGTAWNQPYWDFGSNNTGHDHYGIACDVDGLLAVVGVTGQTVLGTPELGAVHAYVANPGESPPWLEEDTLIPSDTQSFMEFGHAVSLSMDTAVIGAPRRTLDVRVPDIGAAYVFTRTAPGDWQQAATLFHPQASANDRLGDSVAIHGDVIVVGIPQRDDAGESSGGALVFRNVADNWTDDGVLPVGALDAFDMYGLSVTVNGDWIAVGAPFDDDAGTDAGAVYLFNYDGQAWTLHEKLLAYSAQPEALFGAAVSMTDSWLAVGAPSTSGSDGAGHMFRYNGAEWVQKYNLIEPESGSATEFGKAVAVADDWLFLGAPEHDGVGQVFAYDLANCPADTNCDESVDVTDLVNVIIGWGSADAAGDVDNNGIVNVSDLIEVIANWGLCPGATGASPDSLEEAVEAAGLLYPEDWQLFLDHADDENYRCWMEHYLTTPCGPFCPWGPNCPGPNPF